MTEVNPSHLGKAALLVSKEDQEARIQAARYLPGIKEGIRHLHSLGYVHNDLTPSDIMITEDDIPVIMDFDTATPPGAALDQAKRTYGWFDPETVVAQASNDLEAIEELRVWLCGSAAEQFRFKECKSRQTVENSRGLYTRIYLSFLRYPDMDEDRESNKDTQIQVVTELILFISIKHF